MPTGLPAKCPQAARCGQFKVLVRPHRAARGASTKEKTLSVAKVIEISASSTKNFEDAILAGVARATDSIDQVKGAWIKEQRSSSRAARSRLTA